MHIVNLTDSEAEALMRPVNGEGGFQSLLRGLQKQFNGSDRSLTISSAQVEKIKRYTMKYGAGGFEDRLDGIQRNFSNLLK